MAVASIDSKQEFDENKATEGWSFLFVFTFLLSVLLIVSHFWLIVSPHVCFSYSKRVLPFCSAQQWIGSLVSLLLLVLVCMCNFGCWFQISFVLSSLLQTQ